MRLADMANEIVELRGTEVRVFGQPTIIEAELDTLTIDTADILDRLEQFEVDTIEMPTLCEECNGAGETYDEEYDESVECYECDGEGFIYEELDAVEAFEQMDDNGELQEISTNNTYNWSAPLSNHLDYRVYKNVHTDIVYIEIKAHRFGDVRGNYTETAILECTEQAFYEAIVECDKVIEVKVEEFMYDCIVSPLRDTIEVYNEDGTYVNTFSVYDHKELVKELTDYLK